MAKLFAYTVRPATKKIPEKFETETQHHEGIAGVLGAIDYFEWIGKEFGSEYAKGLSKDQGRRLELKKGMAAIHAYHF